MTPLEVDGLLNDFDVGPLNVTRRAAPTRDEHGEYPAASPSTVVLSPVAVCPPEPDQLLQVPEADRHRAVIGVYTRQRLHNNEGGFAADVVTWNGRPYRVVSVMDLEQQGEVFISMAVQEDAP